MKDLSPLTCLRKNRILPIKMSITQLIPSDEGKHRTGFLICKINYIPLNSLSTTVGQWTCRFVSLSQNETLHSCVDLRICTSVYCVGVHILIHPPQTYM